MEKSLVTKRGAPQWILYFLMLALIGVAAFTLWQNTQLKKQYDEVVNNPAASSKVQEEKARVTVDNLKKILKINGDEQPAVALIQDVTKTKESNQEFYKDAENGDALIVYSSRAIIYREKDNQIINIAPIINPAAAGTGASSSSTSSVTSSSSSN